MKKTSAKIPKTNLGTLFSPSFPALQVLFNYSSSHWPGDFRAALNVALLAIPQGMAYALVAGLPIQYGLLGSAFAAIFGGLFGRDRFITLGPTNATAVLLFGVFAGLGMINQNGMGSESTLFVLPWILLFAGIFLLLAAFLRISFLVQFVSRTVITAYVTTASLLIIANQAKHVLGLSGKGEEVPSEFWAILVQALKGIAQASPPSIWLSIITAIIFLLLQTKFKITMRDCCL